MCVGDEGEGVACIGGFQIESVLKNFLSLIRTDKITRPTI